MAGQPQTQGQLQEALAILKRRIWQIVLPAVVTGSVGVMAATLLPRKYEAFTQIELVDVSLPLRSVGFDPGFLKDDVWAADYHIKSTERLRRVIEDLEWQDFQTLPPDGQRRFIKRVVDDLIVRPRQPPNTNATFLELRYSDADPQRAAQFLNEVRERYITDKVESERFKAVKARDKLQTQNNEATAAYDAAHHAARELRRQYNLSPTQQAPGGGRMRDEDPVFARLSQSQQRRQALQQDLTRARNERGSLQEQYEAEPADIPETEVNPGVNLSAELARIETEIAQHKADQVGLRPAHSRYQTAQTEIERLEAQREQLMGRSTQTTTEVRTVPNPKRKLLLDQIDVKDVEIAGLSATLEELNKTIEELLVENQQRSEIYARLSYLDSALDLAKTSRDATNAAFTRQRTLVDLLSQPEFAPFEVTEYAFPPAKPSSPNVPLVIGGALALGLVLGLLVALVAEFGRNGFRGPADTGRALPVPVLAAVNLIRTTGQRRALGFRRGLVGVSTLILAGAILWVTWAYENRPRMLGSDLTRFLDELRASLR